MPPVDPQIADHNSATGRHPAPTAQNMPSVEHLDSFLESLGNTIPGEPALLLARMDNMPSVMFIAVPNRLAETRAGFVRRLRHAWQDFRKSER
jgi:hypothetical protein